MTSRRRLLPLLTVLVLLLGALALVVTPPGGPPPAAAATRVPDGDCRRIDPNLVNGYCLRYSSSRGSGLTWIGTYRTPDGRVFFCIDFLYDSRLPRHAQRVPTDRLVNQLGERVGDAEVAALNYVVSRWASRGSTGSDARDAAIALIVREVMDDGTKPGGLVVYPGGLDVGERVRPPVGGLDRRVMRLARQMWRTASQQRGPWRVRFDRADAAPLRLGQTRDYRVRVVSAAGRPVRGARVRLRCTGPVRCPGRVLTGATGAQVTVRPTDVGRFRLLARVTGPSSDGVLYRQRGWSTHGGGTARPAGVQRGWIAQSNEAVASVEAVSRVRVAQPTIVTRTSAPLVAPTEPVHDVVTVTGLAPGYDAEVVGELHGPFAAQPGAGDCTPDTVAGRVTSRVRADGTYDTPPVVVRTTGYYTWVQRLPGDTDTLAVTTPCGLVEETTRVQQRTPVVATTVSDQHALVGSDLHDSLVLTGISARDRVELRWRLHGPLTPRGGTSCAALGWSLAPIAASGTVRATGPGRYRTPPTRLTAPGCYTYSVQVPATAVTTATSSPAGLAVETSLVTRRVTPVVPEVPTGLGGATWSSRSARSTRPDVGPRAPVPLVATADPSAYEPGMRVRPRWLTTDYRPPAGAARATGTQLRLDRLGVRVDVVDVGLDHGTMAVPFARDKIGWLRTTAAPGDLIGTSVMAGHTGDAPGQLGALDRAKPGDVVTWGSERFSVLGVRRVPRSVGLPAELFRTDGPRRLQLVTCAGRRRLPDGRIVYLDNLVVSAQRVA